MRWDDLFADLSAQADVFEGEQLDLDASELAVAEQARIALVERLLAAVGGEVAIGVDGASHAGVLRDATASWVLVEDGAVSVLVPVAAVRWAAGLGGAAPSPTASTQRLGLGHALRGLAEIEAVVRVSVPGRTLVGVITRVGADHLDIELDGTVTEVTVPFAALLSVSQ